MPIVPFPGFMIAILLGKDAPWCSDLHSSERPLYSPLKDWWDDPLRLGWSF